MGSRIELHRILEDVLGSKNVYFQPPASYKMSYPAIVYNLSKIESKQADNKKYIKNNKYTVTLIHSNPDNTVKEDLLELEYCSFSRSFASDGLHHYVYELFY